MKENTTFDSHFHKYLKYFLYFVAIVCLLPLIFTRESCFPSFTQETGVIGDTIGGTMGPFVAIAAAILTFFAFWVQYKANEQQKADMKDQKAQYAAERVETRYLEMVKICRENIYEMKYEKYSTIENKLVTHEGRRAAVIIFREFTECLRDINFLFWSKNPNYYLNNQYREDLQIILDENNLRASLLDLIKIDIAYHIIYFGLGTESRISIEHNFKHKYQSDFYGALLNFISSKPRLEDKQNYKIWSEITERIKFNQQDLKNEDPERAFILITSDIDEKIETLKLTNPYYKYYGGHQHRLGHYFRHLFNTYLYLDTRTEIVNDEKYLLSKLLRSQLSTYEQALILVNSISSLGMTWEYLPKAELQVENSYSKGKIISTYNVITNLPGEHLSEIKYKNFYPQVKYEFDGI